MLDKVENKIIIKLKGGLGNQMFQYALAHVLAEKTSSKVYIDKSFFKLSKKTPGHTPRKFELSIFNNSYYPVPESFLKEFQNPSFIKKIKRELGLNYPKIYSEPSSGFHQEVLSVKPPVYLIGYFQSYKYFKGFELKLKKIFSFPMELMEDKNLQLLNTLKQSATVSLHIRRGDYINDSATKIFHGSCSKDYYLEAITVMTSNLINPLLVFFSDDEKWVEEQFRNLPYNKIFINQNTGSNSWKDMCLMSNCTNNIIANSSFSWWAAFLNSNPQKKIIAPKNWFAKLEHNSNVEDLIPSNWILL